jgi:hypothetical protein
MVVMVDYREDPYIHVNCPHCGLPLNESNSRSIVTLQKSELEVSIDEGTVKEKLNELENLDFYKRIVEFARTRRI